MIFDDFVALLVAECEADGNDRWVQGLLDQAKAKVTGGKGEQAFLTNSTVNGKTFERRFQFSALDTVRACRRALNVYNNEDDAVSVTIPSFSNLIR